MNAQKLNQKTNRLSYRKDYTKLESIFDAAVERMHRKKIIYYATDRIYSDDSRKIRARETYKETAWAKPVSTEDIKTEVIQLAKENVIPISDTILNDNPSMISFLELMGEDNIEMVESTGSEETLEQPVIKEEIDESPKAEAVMLKDLFDLEETIQETSPETEELTEAVKLTDLVTEEISEEPEVIKEESTIPEQVETQESTIYERYQQLKAELRAKEQKDVVEEKTLIIEESATEKTEIGEQLELEPEESTQKEITEEVEQSPEEQLDLSESLQTEGSNDYLQADYDQFLEFSNQVLDNESIPEDMSLSELLASIQEDDSYLTRDEVESPLATEAEVEPETQALSEEMEAPVEEIDTLLEEKPLDELKEETMQVQESPLDVEIKEIKPKRRIQLDEVDTQDLYNSNLKVEDKPKEKKLNQNLIEKINNAKKEYMLSRISFFIALFLTGVFIVMFFRSFNGIDYFSLILSLVGAFLVWDLSSKRILLMAGLIEAAVIASMIYVSYTTGMPLDYFHYVWLLVVPLLISSSFIFKKSRENYASIVNGKDVKLETN